MNSPSKTAVRRVIRLRLVSLFAMLVLTATVAVAGVPPAPPATPGASAITPASIKWSWVDTCSYEIGFILWSDAGAVTPSTVRTTTPPNATSWTQTGLAANSLYSFQVAAGSIYGPSTRTMPLSAWTLAVVPAMPTITSLPAFEIAVGANDGNPPQTAYAIECTTLGQWLQATGNLGATPLFQTAAAWGSVAVTGLTPGTAYSFGIVAQNGAGAVTDMGPEASGTTAAPITVPDLGGLSISGAEQALVSATLILGAVSTDFNETQPFGAVFRQDPPPGTRTAINTPVDIVISRGSSPVTVPDLAGLLRTDAESAIVAAALAVGTETGSYSSSVASGRVISQNPAAGTQVQRGQWVRLVLSRGPVPVIVPFVTGLNLADAKTLILNAGLTLGTESDVYSSTTAKDNVISQDPAPGTLADPGTPVSLTVSLGSAQAEGEPEVLVTVPDVTLKPLPEAQATLVAALLAIGSTAEVYSDTVPAQSVVTQSPAAGTQTKTGSLVNLGISLGPTPTPGEGEPPISQVTVPDVTTLPLEQAKSVIAGAGLALGSQTEAHSSSVPACCIAGQSPTAGVQVTPGTGVNLVISRGPTAAEGEGEPVSLITVPNVTMLSLSQAEAVLVGAGLVAGAQNQVYSGNTLAGTILAQDPVAGLQVNAGTAVDLSLSLGPPPAEGEGEPGPKVAVPNVVTVPLVRAQILILAANLALGAQTQVYDKMASGCVVSQDPAADVQVDRGTTVSLVLSLGPPPPEGEGEPVANIAVPDVTGMPILQAQTTITLEGLVPEAGTQVYSGTVRAGSVISQSPQAGLRVAGGAMVHLVVSLGPDPLAQEGEVPQEGETEAGVAVPLVRNMTPDEANSALVAANLAPGAVREAYSDAVPADLVIATSPGAKTVVPPNSVVDLIVSLGPTKPGGCMGGCTGGTLGQKARKGLGDLLLTGLSLVALQFLARQPGGRGQ